MSNFTFEYEPLLRYRHHRRDLVRQLLARLLADHTAHVEQRRQLESSRLQQLREIDELTRQGSVDVTAAAGRRFHGGVLLGEMQTVDRQREAVEQQLQLCRRALAEADRDVRILENLRERRRAEHEYEWSRRAQNELEDAWTAGRSSEVTS